MTDPAPDRRSLPRRWLLFATAASILVALSLTMVMGVRSLAALLQSSERHHEVIRTAGSLLASVRALESNSRGFRVTERTEFYAAYVQSRTESRAHLERLEALTTSAPAQLARARVLAGAIEKRIAVSDRFNAIQLQEGGEAARRAALGATAGYERMDEVERLLRGLEREEDDRLRGDRSRIDRLVWWMSGGLIVGTALPLVLLGVLLGLTLRENRRTAALEYEARLAAEELRALLLQRDRLSEQRHKLSQYAGMLQSCQTVEEAMAVTAELVRELLPEAGGRGYVLHPSEAKVESLSEFGPQVAPSAPVLHPGDCWALRRGQPHPSGEAGQMRCPHVAADAPADAWTLCLPLAAQATSLGLLYLNGRAQRPLGEDRAIVEAIAEQLGLALINLRLREELRSQSLRDPLTGLCNRRSLDANLGREMLRCERRQQPLSVILLDIDHFKHFNDTYGHAAGDAVLAGIGHLLAKHARAEDLMCRWGGEEFALLLPETSAEAAVQRAEEVRLAIAEAVFPYLGQTLGPVTASLGVATAPQAGRTPEELLRHADAALYQAKAQGRDRVVAA